MAIKLVDSWLGRLLNRIDKKYHPDKFWRIPSIAYTLEHKLAFMEREHYLLGRYSLKGLLHDWDKLFLYLVPLSDAKLQQIHMKRQPHHMESQHQNKVEHIIESCIDIDCAPLTKADKPYLMFDVMMHVYSDKLEQIVPVLLAVTPNSVTPDVTEMDASRQAKYPAYLFKSKTKEQAVFQRLQRVIQEVVQGLPDDNTIRNALPEHYPEYLDEMTPAQIFLKSVAILAQTRREVPDVPAMRKTLLHIQSLFKDTNEFVRRKEIPTLEHDALRKMKHPFIVERVFKNGACNQACHQMMLQRRRTDNQHH